MIQQRVQEVLAAWREAERQLELAEDPEAIASFEARIEQLREAYRRATTSAGIEQEPSPHVDTPAH